YSGRKPLSPALKGRFRHLPIRQYNPAELMTVAEKVLPETLQGKIIAVQLTEQHCRLRAYLQLNKIPLQPTSLDLQNVARAVIRGGDFSENGLYQCLNQHYRLYLMAAKISLEELPEPATVAVSKSAFDSELCEWFNQTVSGIDRPWLIRRSDFNSIDEKCHEIRVKTEQGEEEAKTEITKRVAQTRWRASGLSLKPNHSDDILTQALYRHWQQRWFDHNFGQTGVGVDSVFPLTIEQGLTLNLSANRPYLLEANRRISDWNSKAVRLWPAFWHQISALPNHWVDDYIDEALAVNGDNAAEQHLPQAHEKQAPALDQRTNHEPQPVTEALTIGSDNVPQKYIPENVGQIVPALDQITDYENQETQQLDDYIVFDKQDHFPGIYRWWAEDVYVSAEGYIKEIDISNKYMQGAEFLIPDRLPGRDQDVTLTSDQTLATFDWTSNDGQYALPSLTVNDYIVALRIEPDLPFILLRDRYTGIHTLSVPGAKPHQSIRFAYVVEQREPGKKTRTGRARQAQSTGFDARCCEGMETVLKEVFTNINEQPQKVREPLRTIQNAKNTTQRIEAIKDYCHHFSGDARPKRTQNFFEFLVTQRQGSCRHRVPVFIAFCRYFGIPCR
ncbi:transglutaminase-like domain-containing protein, partial [Endozoicomonas sp. SESOKO2]|uniref:transglutaminase-like domain-containing protein n=1 Tax=Endozoicomonas sp. SESOKO2 TaxID=2828743 RepID=UPI0021489779